MVFLSYISDPGKSISVLAGCLSGFFFKTMAEMALGAEGQLVCDFIHFSVGIFQHILCLAYFFPPYVMLQGDTLAAAEQLGKIVLMQAYITADFLYTDAGMEMPVDIFLRQIHIFVFAVGFLQRPDTYGKLFLEPAGGGADLQDVIHPFRTDNEAVGHGKGQFRQQPSADRGSGG